MTEWSLEDRARLEVAREMGDKELVHGANPDTAPVHQLIHAPVMVDAAGLMAFHFPPRERLLTPWLLSQSLSMIYAPRGIGKTHVALGVSYALASGGEFLGWKAPHPVRVAYLDGEMPGADLRSRVQAIADSARKQAQPGFLQFMTPDLQPNGIMPNLYDRVGQAMIVEAIGEAQVIIVDNISALVRGGKENEGESWQPVAEWALRMRASGRSVVFIHHAGKGGSSVARPSVRICWIPSFPCADQATTRPTKAHGSRCISRKLAHCMARMWHLWRRHCSPMRMACSSGRYAMLPMPARSR